MKRDGAEDRGREGESSCSVKEGGTPTGEVFIAGGDQRKAIMNRDFGGSQGKPKIRLGEGGHCGAEDGSKLLCGVARDSNGKERSLMVVDGKPGGLLEKLQDMLGTLNGINRAVEEDQSVVGILKDGARVTGDKGVSDRRGEGGVLEQPTKDISDNNEKVRRNGVTLTEPSPAVDPAPWDAIEEYGSFPTVKEITDPVAPFIRKASTMENAIQAIPVNTVKSFVEVELKNNGWSIPAVATVEQFSSISKVISNAAPKHKTGLVIADQ